MNETRASRRPGELLLHLRGRVELFKGSDVWNEVFVEQRFAIAKTAILLCDVWDDHWCGGAARRVEALAPRIEATVARLRTVGVQVIHAPSDTMAFYADTSFRRRMQSLASVALPTPRDLPDPPLPIDDSDGGCDSGELPWHRAWSRQHPGIGIQEPDVISDDGTEIYSFLRHQGITNLLFAGVHTNMCVLNRSFGIKNMTRWGIRCVLARDLTDTMYNPTRPPYVSHEAGTDLVREHIERYWCPTVLSQDLDAAARGIEANPGDKTT